MSHLYTFHDRIIRQLITLYILQRFPCSETLHPVDGSKDMLKMSLIFN